MLPSKLTIKNLTALVSETVKEHGDVIAGKVAGWDEPFTLESLKQRRREQLEVFADFVLADPRREAELHGFRTAREAGWFTDASDGRISAESGLLQCGGERLGVQPTKKGGAEFSVFDVMRACPDCEIAIASKLADEGLATLIYKRLTGEYGDFIPPIRMLEDRAEGIYHRFYQAFVGEHRDPTAGEGEAGFRLFSPDPRDAPLIARDQYNRYAAGLGLVLVWLATDPHAHDNSADLMSQLAPAFAGWHWKKALWVEGERKHQTYQERIRAQALVLERLDGPQGVAFSRWIEDAVGVFQGRQQTDDRTPADPPTNKADTSFGDDNGDGPRPTPALGARGEDVVIVMSFAQPESLLSISRLYTLIKEHIGEFRVGQVGEKKIREVVNSLIEHGLAERQRGSGARLTISGRRLATRLKNDRETAA